MNRRLPRSRCLARLFLVGALLILGSLARAQSPSAALQTAFEAANTALAEGRYAESAQLYTNLPTGGRTSAALEYNRALAYSRLGDAGRARAHWELAHRLDPRHPLIQSAIERATPPGAERLPLNPLPALSWTDFLTLNEWGTLAMMAVWSWGLLLLLGRWRPGLAAGLRGYTLTCGILALIVTALLAAAWGRRVLQPDAIVLQPDTPVRVSPLDEARNAFTLPAGQWVKTRPGRDAWLMVEDPVSRRFGWARADGFLRLPLR